MHPCVLPISSADLFEMPLPSRRVSGIPVLHRKARPTGQGGVTGLYDVQQRLNNATRVDIIAESLSVHHIMLRLIDTLHGSDDVHMFGSGVPTKKEGMLAPSCFPYPLSMPLHQIVYLEEMHFDSYFLIGPTRFCKTRALALESRSGNGQSILRSLILYNANKIFFPIPAHGACWRAI